MVQLWQETDPEQNAVDLVPADQVPENRLDRSPPGQDQSGRIVSLVHEDTPFLRHGVDHELTFHRRQKLRTVL